MRNWNETRQFAFMNTCTFYSLNRQVVCRCLQYSTLTFRTYYWSCADPLRHSVRFPVYQLLASGVAKVLSIRLMSDFRTTSLGDRTMGGNYETVARERHAVSVDDINVEASAFFSRDCRRTFYWNQASVYARHKTRLYKCGPISDENIPFFVAVVLPQQADEFTSTKW